MKDITITIKDKSNKITEIIEPISDRNVTNLISVLNSVKVKANQTLTKLIEIENSTLKGNTTVVVDSSTEGMVYIYNYLLVIQIIQVIISVILLIF